MVGLVPRGAVFRRTARDGRYHDVSYYDFASKRLKRLFRDRNQPGSGAEIPGRSDVMLMSRASDLGDYFGVALIQL